MDPKSPSELAGQIQAAVRDLIGVLEASRGAAWSDVPGDGVWSVGKEVEHVIEALDYHGWIVRLTIGERVSSRQPGLERARMTTHLSPAEAARQLQEAGQKAAMLVSNLSAEQLALATRPPRARSAVLGETIEAVLIGHLHGHRRDIEAKLARAPR